MNNTESRRITKINGFTILKKKIFRVLICIIVMNTFIISSFFVPNVYGLQEEIDSEFGESPIIDGYIDFSSNEWNEATKVPIELGDLPISLWVMQDEINLYISIQFELEGYAHKDTEFVGMIISNSSSIIPEEFLDVKIVQFSNKTSNDFIFLDYNINNSEFLNDTKQNGMGAAKIEGIDSTYEFSIPINEVGGDENMQDVLLEYGNMYAFNITYGETPVYPGGIKKSEIVLITIKNLSITEPPLWDLVFFILNIIIFSILGILYGFYIYKIFKLKEKIERIKR
ncbi:MAG: hypothetical protein JSV23_09280 [Promethearchaeota archaeon]|nr:MAG: hypothetical protein JSV23_09280 [Candidatus Lokiarchaeota archaeon]